MIDKISPIISKIFKPVINIIGKSNLNKEKILGIVLRDKSIQIAEISYKKNITKLDNYSNQQLAGIGEDQDIFSATTYLSDQIKNALDSVKTKATDVAISLSSNQAQTFNLQVPIMDQESLDESTLLGGFWEQFEELPENLEEFEISYQILKSNEELGVMDVVVVIMEKRIVEAYANIFRLAGYNPVIIDIETFSNINSQVLELGEEGLETPNAIFNYTKDNKSLTISSNKGFEVFDLNIMEADQVLLDTVEEVEAIDTEFWDEIFERLSSQIKQQLVEYETKYEFDPINFLKIITDKKVITNLSKGIERQLGEIVIDKYNPENSLEFSDEAKKYIDSLSDKSLAAEAIGSAMRKLNSFNLKTKEAFSINLLSGVNQIKINRRSKSLGNACLLISSIFVLIFLTHVVPFKILKIISNSSQLSVSKGLGEDLEQKQNLLKGYQAKLSKIKKQTKTANAFGSNLITTANLYANLTKIVPKDIRFTNFALQGKSQIVFSGVAKNDQAVIQLMNNFSDIDFVSDAKIEAMVEFTDQDRTNLYNLPANTKPEDIPKEIISKKFNSKLSLNPVEGETFDNEKIISKLNKKKKK